MRYAVRFLIFFCLIFHVSQAAAIPFADYVYQNVRRGNISAVERYLRKGYNIDAVDTRGMTALCQAVANDDNVTYRRLKRLGASPEQRCMKRFGTNNEGVYYNRQYAGGSNSVVYPQSDHTALYVAGGLLAAGGVAALALSGGSGGGKHKHNKTPDECPTGQELIDGECRPIECPEGQHLVGNECQPIECPEGQHLVGNDCVPDHECPENTKLVGDKCVAIDIDIDETSDLPLYGIASDNESVYNLYSSPSYPDDESTISLKNKGSGDVYGIYGLRGEVFNSYVIGKDDAGNDNEKPVGVGTININDEGSGTVYGMYSRISDITQYKEAINASGHNSGEAHGDIKIVHTGGGDTYGLAGDVRAYNAYAGFNGRAYGNIDIEGDGDIYGIYGYVAAVNAVSPFNGTYAKGDIIIKEKGDGDVYGMMINKDDIPGAGSGDGNTASWFAFNAYSGNGEVIGKIDIHNEGNGNAYGMYGGQQLYNAMSYGGVDAEGRPKSHAVGEIDITNLGDGDVYGMYMPEADTSGIIANVNNNNSESTIRINNEGSGVSTGMRGGAGTSIINSGDIYITHTGAGKAIGIYGEENSKISNSGRVEIFGCSDSSCSEGINSSATAYGIYAKSGAEVVNSGVIEVNGFENGAGIYLESGASLENSGVVAFNGNADDIITNGDDVDIYGTGVSRGQIDFDDMGVGEVVLADGGQFFAQSLAGNMGVSKNVVMDSFQDEYKLEGALQADNIDNLNLISKSALFDAQSIQNEDGGFDVVLERKKFDSIVEDKSIAQFFENNYELENNSGLYNAIKSLDSNEGIQTVSDDVTGKDILPGFRLENALVYNHLSRQFSDDLFNRPYENFVGGYKYMDVSRDAHGSLVGSDSTVHAAYGMLKSQTDNGMTYGIGASVAQLKSDYDDHSSRKSNIFGAWLPVGYDFHNGTKWFSKLYAGYEDGSYDRQSALGKYSSDLTSYQYGLGNEIRHNVSLGKGFVFTPSAELNLLGIYQDSIDEGKQASALQTDKINSLSLEGGLGAYLSKQFQFGENNKLGVQIGGIYYVEFLDPDEKMRVRMNGMDGHYRLSHSSDDDRAVFSARVNYTYKNILLYGMVEQETNNNKALSIDAGLQYNFN